MIEAQNHVEVPKNLTDEEKMELNILRFLDIIYSISKTAVLYEEFVIAVDILKYENDSGHYTKEGTKDEEILNKNIMELQAKLSVEIKNLFDKRKSKI